MRKNKMMRAASALLVAVLLTTSTISGTFAKYVTQDSAKDVARVAKWGVELQVEGNLFGETYVDEIKNSDDPKVLAVQADHKFNTADGGAMDDVVAPGTENKDGFVFSINGVPEVSGEVVIDNFVVQNIFLNEGTYGVMIKVDETTDVIDADNFKEFGDLYIKNGSNYVKATAYTDTTYYTLEDEVVLDVSGASGKYYPVMFNLDGKYVADNCEIDSLNIVASSIAGLIAGKEGENYLYDLTFDPADTTSSYKLKAEAKNKFNPNTDLATRFTLGGERITWEWKFERGNTEAEKNMYNGADTILGNLMADAIDTDDTDDTYEVVKLVGSQYEPLVEFTDYCLNLKFELSLTVAQINKEANA